MRLSLTDSASQSLLRNHSFHLRSAAILLQWRLEQALENWASQRWHLFAILQVNFPTRSYSVPEILILK